MAKDLTRSHTLILPLVLLSMVLIEDMATVEVRSRITVMPLRVAVLMLLYGVGFTLAAGALAPWLKRILVNTRRGARPVLGFWGFYLLAYAALYVAFYVWERWGGATPPSTFVTRWIG